jgi:hypothetical protein
MTTSAGSSFDSRLYEPTPAKPASAAVVNALHTGAAAR